MRYIYGLILSALLLASGLVDAQIKVNALPSGTTPGSADYAIADQSGTTNKVTYGQVAQSVQNLLSLGTWATQTYPSFVSGDCLSNNGTAWLWTACGTTSPGGLAYSIQYNNSGTFNGLIPGSTGTYCLIWSSLVAAPGLVACPGGGSVTTVSVASANGLTGTVANASSTPAITLVPTFTGISYSSGSGFQSAIASNFPTLNQNTTGSAATATNIAGGATSDFVYQTSAGTTGFLTPIAAQGALNTITPNTQSGTSYTFGAADANGITLFTSSTAVTATIPVNTTYAYPVGTKLTVVQSGTGIVTPTAASGVTMCVSGLFACTIHQWGTYGVGDVQVWQQLALNQWTLISESPCGGQSTCTLGGYGVVALPTSSIASGACVNTQVFNYYIDNPNHVTIDWSFDSDPTTVTGYFPASSGTGHLELYVFQSYQEENFKLCNWTASAITPGAMSIDQSLRIP